MNWRNPRMILLALAVGAAVGLLTSLLPAPWDAITLWTLGVLFIGPIVARYMMQVVLGPNRGILPFSFCLVLVPKWTQAEDATMAAEWALVDPSLGSYSPVALHMTAAAPTRRFTCTNPAGKRVTVLTSLGGVGGLEWIAGLLWLTERRGVAGPLRRRLSVFQRVTPALVSDGKGWLRSADGDEAISGGVLPNGGRYLIADEDSDEWVPAVAWGIGVWRQRPLFTTELLSALEAERAVAAGET